MPPVFGSALAISAIVNAPQSAKIPPAIHAESIGSGPGSLSAMPAGERKMPEPMVEPMTTAIALHRPMLRWSPCGAAGEDIRRKYPAGLHGGRVAGDISLMPSLFMTVLFWMAVAAAIIAQGMILRSTVRAWRQGAAPAPATERVFAFGPALVLLVVLWLSWREATRPPIIEVQFDPSTQGITL
jgi:hypothetical protein